jgi:hypothetical protein
MPLPETIKDPYGSQTYTLGDDGKYYNIYGQPAPGYVQNVTGFDPSNPDPNRPTYNYNPTQFADQSTANYWAQKLGGTVQNQNLEFFNRSEPERTIAMPGGGNLNAGLVADTAARYGSAPGSYGAFELYRDQNEASGTPYTDPYAQGGSTVIDPRTRGQQFDQINIGDVIKTPNGNQLFNGGGWVPTTQPVNKQIQYPNGAINAPRQGVAPAALPGAYTIQSGSRGAGTTLGTAAGSQVARTPSATGQPLSYEQWKAQQPGQRPSTAAPALPTVNRQTDSTGRASTSSPDTAARTGLRDASTDGTVLPDDQTAYQRYRDTAPRATDHAYTDPGAPSDFSQPPSYATPSNGINREPIDSRNQTDEQAYAAYQQYIQQFQQGQNPGAPLPGGAQPAPGGPPAGGSALPPYRAPGYTPSPNYPPSGSSQPPDANYPGNQSPSQNFRYSFQGQGNGNYQPYGGVQPFLSNSGEDLQYRAENDRNLAIGQGGALDQDLRNYTQYQHGRASDYEDRANSAYAPISEGRGGYSDAEKNSILNNDALQGLQQTEGEANSNYLTDEERAGITGDPNRALDQLGRDEAGIDLASNTRDAKVRDSLDRQASQVRSGLEGQDTAVRGAYGSQAANMRATLGGMAQNVRGAYADAAGNVRGALNYGEQNARSYLDRSRLGLSSDYLDNYHFGERDQQDIIDRAGRSIGNQNQADEDRLLRDASAAGNTSPLALQAARNRLRQTGAVTSAGALQDARIRAKELALQTTQTRENTRLGAEQNYANLGMGTELSLGGRRTAAEQALGEQAQGNERYLGDAALNTEGTLGAAQIGAESYLGNQRTQAEHALGTARTAGEQTLGQSHVDIGSAGANRNLSAFQTADEQASQRANAIATNRQATNQANQNTRFTRGQYIYGQGSAANRGFADTRLGQEAEYRKYLGDQGTQAGQNVTIGNQQRIGNFGTQFGAQNAATGNAINNSKTPGLGLQIAGLFEKGGVVSGPQRALVGEAGRELIVDLDKFPRYGDGGVVDPYTGGSGETDFEGNALPTDDQNTRLADDPRMNPLYRKIRNAVGTFSGGPNSTSDPGGYKKPGGGYLSQGLALAGLFAADGAVVTGAQREQVAPGVEMVDGPQLMELGRYGAQAVVPMTPRKSNKVRLEDIPKLAEKYGNYGRESAHAYR